MRSRLFWLLLSGGLLLLAAVLTIVAVSAPRLSANLFPLWENAAEPLLVLLGPPLILLAVVLVALFGQDSGPHSLSKGDLDLLIRRKHQGALLQRSRRIRESAARVGRCFPRASQSARVKLAPLGAPENILDRLVQLK